MKRLLVLSILVPLMPLVMSAQSPDSLWNKAAADYAAGDFEAAVAGFTAIEKLGYESPELYYNIANSYYKTGHFLGKSILYYEKALKLEPSYEDAAFNLGKAMENTVDRIEDVPDFILVTWARSFRDLMSSDAWAWTAMVLLLAVAVLVLVFRFSCSLPLRRTAFALAIVASVFVIISAVSAFSLRSVAENGNEGVVTVPVCSVKSSPSSTDQSLFILHEGTKVTVVDILGDWIRVELSDGRQGWMENKDLEII